MALVHGLGREEEDAPVSWCGELCACFFFFSLLLLLCVASTRPSGPTSTARHGWDRPRAAPSVFRNERGCGMSRCMRAPQVVPLCVPKLPYVAAAARRRCVRAACNASASRARAIGMDKLSGCISSPELVRRCIVLQRFAYLRCRALLSRHALLFSSHFG